jgi:hydroxyacylglutathione hydrolase
MTDYTAQQPLSIEPIRAFQDNYIWLLTRPGSNRASVVDPGDAAPVLELLNARGLSLDSILLTHHHADHTGGLPELLERFPAPVYGPASGRVQGITHPLKEGDQLTVLGCGFRILEVPGHTLDHIAWFGAAQPDAGIPKPLLFCGDTLFAAGCGRLFEGSAETMYASLQKLASLPGETLVYCAHEYTLSNLRFAMAAEPDNAELRERLKQDTDTYERTGITLPSTIVTELRTNPFLRCHTEGLRKNAAQHASAQPQNTIEVFAAVRRWKDGFR